MPSTVDLSRLALRRDQILEVHFGPMPEPPPEMLKLPGVRDWFNALKLMRERDTQAMQRLVNNLQLSANGSTAETPT